jgi:DNA adenine methylase
MDQSGNYKMNARFKRDELIEKIREIAAFKNQISIANCEAEDYINFYVPLLPRNSLTYLDPPYYEQGGDLYLDAYKKSGHASLARIIQRDMRRKWILSYDGVPDIIDLYNNRRHFLYKYPYSAGKAYKGTEIFIFSDQMQLPNTSSIDYIRKGLENLAAA